MPYVGNDVICECGIRYAATIDLATVHRDLRRTMSDLAALRRQLATEKP